MIKRGAIALVVGVVSLSLLTSRAFRKSFIKLSGFSTSLGFFRHFDFSTVRSRCIE